jgi:hypothetical protein
MVPRIPETPIINASMIFTMQIACRIHIPRILFAESGPLLV